MKMSKVKQVLADLALSQVAHKKIEKLTLSEYRRLVIGVQLMRDPGEYYRIFRCFIEESILLSCVVNPKRIVFYMLIHV